MVLMAIDHREAARPTLECLPGRVETDAGHAVRQTNLWRDGFYRFSRNRAAVVAAIVFVIIVLFCLLVPIFSPYDPNKVNFSDSYLPPSLQHPFGTDKFGRDLFTRVAVGGRISIGIGFAGTMAILTVGVVYGSLAG